MNTQCLSYLYAFDLLSYTPQLRIFNQSTYKTTFSLFLTIIIILISVALSIFLLTDYLKYEDPVVIYTKENDRITNRTLKLKDSFFLFGLFNYTAEHPIPSKDAFYQGIYVKTFFNATEDIIPITLEKCEFGKNIDIKFKHVFEENKILEFYHSAINDYFCISSKHENLTISYLPNIGEYAIIVSPFIQEDSNYKPEEILSLVITEQDLIEHNNRDKPFNSYYAVLKTPNYNSDKYTTTNINLQFIKYEADNKLILRDYINLKGKSYVKMEYFQNVRVYNYLTDGMGEIHICMQDFFDHYKRSYKKLQALFTEIVTIIHFLFTLGQKICDILLTKKMAKDIVGNILKHKEYINEINRLSIQQNNKSNMNFNDKFKSKISFEICNIKERTLSENDSSQLESNIKIKKKSKRKEIENKLINSKKIEKLNNFDIIKSFFCFKNKKTILINKCCDIINKDICLENILKKIYELENIYYLLSKKEDSNLNINQYVSKRFQEVNNLINQIDFREEIKDNKSRNQIK